MTAGGVDCERICGREDETFSKSALRRPSVLLSAGRRRAAAPELAIFEQNAQRIGIHVPVTTAMYSDSFLLTRRPDPPTGPSIRW
jgi:hypothetical protein